MCYNSWRESKGSPHTRVVNLQSELSKFKEWVVRLGIASLERAEEYCQNFLSMVGGDKPFWFKGELPIPVPFVKEHEDHIEFGNIPLLQVEFEKGDFWKQALNEDRVVAGYATVRYPDSEDDVVFDLEACNQYMKENPKPLTYYCHDWTEPDGFILRKFEKDDKTLTTHTDDIGWFVISQFGDWDDKYYKMAKDGALRGYSILGSFLYPTQVIDGKKVRLNVKIGHVSHVPLPMNKLSFFSFIKSHNSRSQGGNEAGKVSPDVGETSNIKKNEVKKLEKKEQKGTEETPKQEEPKEEPKKINTFKELYDNMKEDMKKELIEGMKTEWIEEREKERQEKEKHEISKLPERMDKLEVEVSSTLDELKKMMTEMKDAMESRFEKIEEVPAIKSSGEDVVTKKVDEFKENVLGTGDIDYALDVLNKGMREEE